MIIRKSGSWLVAAAAIAAVALTACAAPAPSRLEQEAQQEMVADVVAAAQGTLAAQPPETAPTEEAPPTATPQPVVGEPTVRYTLITGGGYSGLVFVGQGGEIDGVVNPTLTADPGDVVEITLINRDNIMHNLTIDEFGVATPDIAILDEQAVVTFAVGEEGSYIYYCSITGHRQAGMFGTLQVGQPQQAEAATGESVVRNPADVPAPVGDRPPTTLRVDLNVMEVTGQLADGTTYDYFTFGGQVPGPMIRVRIGDTVELHLRNDGTSHFPHSIDLHAVTGPGGGAVYTQTNPGEETMFTFQALNPGLYVYHCATPSIPHHISNGMYGLILVEPEGGLPPVDREFYVMQGEIYTVQPFGTVGHLDFDPDRMSHEAAEYVIFNGMAGGLTLDENALRANVGETVRIFFGVGGPNYTSSFHVIGEIFDRVYDQASLTAPALTDVQTTLVPPGGATMVEFQLQVPGRYLLVDHALSRLERGLVGFLYAEGEENPAIFSGTPTAGSGH
jgi:nitrite reductase (NO-forming)